MFGVIYTKQRMAAMPFVALVDPAVALPMCHQSTFGSVNPWVGTAGLTTKRSTRRLRRSPT